MSISKSFIISSITILLISCDRPQCKNTNPIFDKFTPDTKEYKDELVKQLNLIGAKNLTYWVADYDFDKNYLLVNIQGNGLCAKGSVLVKDWTKISRIQKKGFGPNRIGAELTGFEMDIIQDSTSTTFVFKNYDSLID